MSIQLFHMHTNVIVCLLFFSMESISAATVPKFIAQVDFIPMLSGKNIKSWKEFVEFVHGCMDLDIPEGRTSHRQCWEPKWN